MEYYAVMDKDKFYQEMGKKLKERNMSRRELAKKVGIPTSTLQTMIERKTDVKAGIYYKICRELELYQRTWPLDGREIGPELIGDPCKGCKTLERREPKFIPDESTFPKVSAFSGKPVAPAVEIDPGAPKDEEMLDVCSVEREPCEISTELEGSWGWPPLTELLFDYTRKALNEVKIAQAEADSCKEQPDAWKYQAEREIKRQRFSALWGVIEAAGLAEEYEKWTRQPETLPY